MPKFGLAKIYYNFSGLFLFFLMIARYSKFDDSHKSLVSSSFSPPAAAACRSLTHMCLLVICEISYQIPEVAVNEQSERKLYVGQCYQKKRASDEFNCPALNTLKERVCVAYFCSVKEKRKKYN